VAKKKLEGYEQVEGEENKDDKKPAFDMSVYKRVLKNNGR